MLYLELSFWALACTERERGFHRSRRSFWGSSPARGFRERKREGGHFFSAAGGCGLQAFAELQRGIRVGWVSVRCKGGGHTGHVGREVHVKLTHPYAGVVLPVSHLPRVSDRSGSVRDRNS